MNPRRPLLAVARLVRLLTMLKIDRNIGFCPGRAAWFGYRYKLHEWACSHINETGDWLLWPYERRTKLW